MSLEALIQTAREEVFAAYSADAAAKGQPFTVKTAPYYSTAQVEFEVVNTDASHSFGYAIARAQSVEWFTYGLGDKVTLGNGDQRATRTETNLNTGGSTNGAFEFVIESISAHSKAPALYFPTLTAFTYSGQGQDADLVKALQGGAAQLYDPTGIASPSQLASPFFLGSVLWQAVQQAMWLEIMFDGTTARQLGGLWMCAQGADAHANVPFAAVPYDNRQIIEEGLVWSKDGEVDSDLILRGRIERPIVVPISSVTAPGDGSTVYTPGKIWLPITMNLHGFEVGWTSKNQ